MALSYGVIVFCPAPGSALYLAGVYRTLGLARAAARREYARTLSGLRGDIRIVYAAVALRTLLHPDWLASGKLYKVARADIDLDESFPVLDEPDAGG